MDELSSRHARRKFSDKAESASKALDFLPSYRLTPDSLKLQISAGKSLTHNYPEMAHTYAVILLFFSTLNFKHV